MSAQVRDSGGGSFTEAQRKDSLCVRRNRSSLCAPNNTSLPLSINRFGGNLDLTSISLIGFSAGGHLSLCLCEHDKKHNKTYPPIHATLLVYPTLRSPTCWCIAGGLWIVPSLFGKKIFKDKNEHCYCYGCNSEAMERLIPSLPEHVMCVTVKCDMLLPAKKHSKVLVKKLEEEGRRVRYLHGGPFWLYHGCGLHGCWGEEGKIFFRQACNIEGGEEKKVDDTRI